MDSKKLLPVLRKFKKQNENEVFEKFFLILNDVLVEGKKTPDEKLLSDALKKETQKFQEMRQKLSDCVDGVYKIEEVIRGRDNIDPEEYFCSGLAYTHHDSCECIARQAFDYGVAYGKILAT